MKTLTVRELKHGNYALVGEFNRNLWKSNDYGNHKAEALLLSAAPDMLEALQGLFEQCAMIHKYGGSADNTKESNTAIALARAAINKALGVN